MRAAHRVVARPREHGPGRTDLHAGDGVDVEAADLEALAAAV